MSIFSDKLTYLMKQNDISDDELGNIVGVNRTTISRWRTGERSPKMDKLPEIANVFKVDPRIFVGEVPDQDISLIYNQLSPERKNKVYEFAEQQLSEQHKVVPFEKLEATDNKDKNLEVLAAHIDENTTEEEMDEITAFIDSLRDDE